MPAPTDNKRALVVDDDSSSRATAERVLRVAGYEVESAEDAGTGLELLRTRPEYAVLVTDKDMPGMNGFALARAAHELKPELAVVLMTAHAERLPKGTAEDLDGYLGKPFRTPQELPEVVKAAIELRAVRVKRAELQKKLAALPTQQTR